MQRDKRAKALRPTPARIGNTKGGCTRWAVGGPRCRELGRSQCSYIRCVKPNAQMKAGVYDSQYVVTQLRCKYCATRTNGSPLIIMACGMVIQIIIFFYFLKCSPFGLRTNQGLGLLQTCEVLKVGLPTRLTYEVLREQLEEALPPKVVQIYTARPDKELAHAALRIFRVPRDA